MNEDFLETLKQIVNKYYPDNQGYKIEIHTPKSKGFFVSYTAQQVPWS